MTVGQIRRGFLILVVIFSLYRLFVDKLLLILGFVHQDFHVQMRYFALKAWDISLLIHIKALNKPVLFLHRTWLCFPLQVGICCDKLWWDFFIRLIRIFLSFELSMSLCSLNLQLWFMFLLTFGTFELVTVALID